jgi:hypothetical protein
MDVEMEKNNTFKNNIARRLRTDQFHYNMEPQEEDTKPIITKYLKQALSSETVFVSLFKPLYILDNRMLQNN